MRFGRAGGSGSVILVKHEAIYGRPKVLGTGPQLDTLYVRCSDGRALPSRVENNRGSALDGGYKIAYRQIDGLVIESLLSALKPIDFIKRSYFP